MKKSLCHYYYRRQRGVTLIELMTAVVVLSILIAIGIPSYTSMVTKIRMDGELNALTNSLNLARSEASKRGLNVYLCPGTNGTCQTATDWTSGWQIVANGVTTPLSVSQGLNQGDTLISNTTNTPNYPQFTPMGYIYFSGTLSLHAPNDPASLRRCIVISAGSWTTVTGATCP